MDSQFEDISDRDVDKMKAEEAKIYGRLAPDYKVDQTGLLLFCPRSTAKPEDRAESFGDSRFIAAGFPASLPYEFGGWLPGNRSKQPTI